MRRTLEDRRNAEELAREHIEELLQLHPNATTADKLEYLINRGYLSSTIAGVMLISESSVKRAKAALKGGRLIGRRGRPTYLTREQEEELERWCIEENSSGRVPPISDVISKVRYLFLCYTCFILGVLTAFPL